MYDYKLIVIGVSYGGLKALSTLIPIFPKDFKIPIVIVQHQNNTKKELLHTILNDISKLEVIEAMQNEKIEKGFVYIAPGGYHLLIEKEKLFSLSMDAPINYSIPSIDVLFESAADVYQDSLIGIILTGANNDGSRGLKAIRQNGGLGIIQKPSSAQVSTMPQSALDFAGADYVLCLKEIANLIVEENYG